MIGAGDMATMFYRLDCEDITKDWSNEKKIALVKKMSKVTLEDQRFYPDERRELWSFSEVPERKFSALKLLSWMEEILKEVNGFDVNPKVTKMMNAIGGIA